MFDDFEFEEEKQENKNINFIGHEDECATTESDDKKLTVYKKKSAFIISKLLKIGLPKKDEQFRLVTKSSFNSVSFLKFIADNENITECYLAVYSIDLNSAKIIDEMAKDGKLGKVTILLSNLRNGSYQKKEIIANTIFKENPNIKLIFAKSHVKILAFKTKENHYIVEGSGNMSSNSRFEQYIFDNCKTIYDFTKKWINEIELYASKKELTIFDFNGAKIKG